MRVGFDGETDERVKEKTRESQRGEKNGEKIERERVRDKEWERESKRTSGGIVLKYGCHMQIIDVELAVERGACKVLHYEAYNLKLLE